MGAYEEAVEEIEAAYEEKRDAVESKYHDRRVRLHQRDTKKKWPKRGGTALGGVAGGAGAVKIGATALAGTIMPFFGGPLALAGGAALGAGAGYVISGKGTDKAIDGYNRAMAGAERVEKGWYNTRETASKQKAKAAHVAGEGATKVTSWTGIDSMLGGSDDE